MRELSYRKNSYHLVDLGKYQSASSQCGAGVLSTSSWKIAEVGREIELCKKCAKNAVGVAEALANVRAYKAWEEGQYHAFDSAKQAALEAKVMRLIDGFVEGTKITNRFDSGNDQTIRARDDQTIRVRDGLNSLVVTLPNGEKFYIMTYLDYDLTFENDGVIYRYGDNFTPSPYHWMERVHGIKFADLPKAPPESAQKSARKAETVKV